MTGVGVDVGGSGLRVARAGAEASVTDAVRRPLDPTVTLDGFLTLVASAVADVTADPDRVTVAIPAFVRPDGTLTECPSLPALTAVPLGRLVTQQLTALGVPAVDVDVVPDLAAAALAEHRLGTGGAVDRFLCVALGTGANAAAVVDGDLVETAFGCLGEAGHVIVDADGPPCPCGGRGCLESIASGYALSRDGREIGLPDARSVVVAARDGRPDALALLERAGAALGRAIASWSALLWPERVAVAGGVAAAGELLLAPARAELRRVGVPYVVADIDVVAAELGRSATLVGVCLLAGR